jgi:hypothetical protein
VQNLRDVVERARARVVLCGDGSDDPGLRTRARAALASRGVVVHGWTDASGRAGRAAEIVRWLEREETRRMRVENARDGVDGVDIERWHHDFGGPNATETAGNRRRSARGAKDKIISFAAADDAPLVAQPGGDALVGRFVMTAPGAGLTAAAADAIVACLAHQSAALERSSSGCVFDGGSFGRFAETPRPDSSDSSRSSSSACEARFAPERTPAGFISFRTSPSRTSLATSMTHRQSSPSVRDAALDAALAAAPRMSVEGTTATFSPPRRLSKRELDKSARESAFALGEGARFITWENQGGDASSASGVSCADADDTMHVVRYG